MLMVSSLVVKHFPIPFVTTCITHVRVGAGRGEGRGGWLSRRRMLEAFRVFHLAHRQGIYHYSPVLLCTVVFAMVLAVGTMLGSYDTTEGIRVTPARCWCV